MYLIEFEQTPLVEGQLIDLTKSWQGYNRVVGEILGFQNNKYSIKITTVDGKGKLKVGDVIKLAPQFIKRMPVVSEVSVPPVKPVNMDPARTKYGQTPRKDDPAPNPAAVIKLSPQAQKIQKSIKEAFDQPYQLTWEQGEYGSYDAYTRLDDGSDLSIHFNLESTGPYGEDEVWQVEFWRGQSLSVTGQGDAQRIFATVLAAINDFIEQADYPELISFSASKEVEPGQNSQSRAKLYDRLVQRYAASWGYLVTRRESGDKVTYELVRKNQLEEGLRDWVAALAATSAMAFALPADAAKAQQVLPTANQQAVEQVSKIMAHPLAQVLKKTAIGSGITGVELAQFMAQCAHETANFTTMKEHGGSLDFKKYDPKHAPKKAKALGNVKVGDGAKYAGRGYIQLTGRDNYKRAGQALGLPLEQRPELVEKPEVAAKVAVWFWKSRVQPKVSNFNDTTQATKPINPGLRGLQARHTNFSAIKQGAMATPKDIAPRGRRT